MYQISGDLGDIKNYKVFEISIAQVITIFNNVFGKELMERYPLFIDNCWDDGNGANCGYSPHIKPLFDKVMFIRLGIDDFGNSVKTVYQFSHELCHFVFYSHYGINRSNLESNEESVCSAMSLVIIKMLFDDATFLSHLDYVKKLLNDDYRLGAKVAEEISFDIHKLKEMIVKNTTE